MKHLLSIAIALICSMGAMAQKYVVDDCLNDSVKVHYINVSTDKDGKHEYSGDVAFHLANGDTIAVTRKIVNREDAVFSVEGKEYVVDSDYLIFADDNAEGTEDIFGDTRSEKHHSAMAHFCASGTFLWTVSIILLLAVAAIFLGHKVASMRQTALLVTPILLILTAVLEAVALYYLGNDAFWWCDSDRIGFWMSLFYLFPYVAFVAFQLYVIKLYSALVVAGTDKKVSLKPMAISIGACIPITIIVALIASLTIGHTPQWLAVVAFFLSLGLGVAWSTGRNIRELGTKAGVAFSVFCAIYFVGAVVAIYGLIVVIFKLIFQILIVCGCIAAILFAGGGGKSGGGSSGGGGGSRMVWRDENGGEHTNEWDATQANRRIAESKES